MDRHHYQIDSMHSYDESKTMWSIEDVSALIQLTSLPRTRYDPEKQYDESVQREEVQLLTRLQVDDDAAPQRR